MFIKKREKIVFFLTCYTFVSPSDKNNYILSDRNQSDLFFYNINWRKQPLRRLGTCKFTREVKIILLYRPHIPWGGGMEVVTIIRNFKIQRASSFRRRWIRFDNFERGTCVYLSISAWSSVALTFSLNFSCRFYTCMIPISVRHRERKDYPRNEWLGTTSG